MTKRKRFWKDLFSGPERAFLLEAVASSLGRSLYIPLIFSSVIFSTGYLFPDEIIENVSIHWLDSLVLPASLLGFAITKFVRGASNSIFWNTFVWSFSGLLSALSPTIFIFIFSGKIVDTLLARLPIGVVAYSVLIAVTAVIQSGLRLSIRRMRTLKQQRAVLIEFRNQLQEQIETMRSDIKSRVDLELAKALEALKKVTNPESLSAQLLRTIDEVIRPLSHRLAGLQLPSIPPKITSISVPVQPVNKGVALARLVAPEIYSFLFLVFILPASFFVQGLIGLFGALAMLSAYVVALTFIEVTTREFFINRILAMFFLPGLAGVFGLGYLLLVSQSEGFGIAVGFVTTSAAVTALMALVSKRLDVLNQLAAVNQETQAVVSVLRQEAWVTKNRLAKAIHGSVQGKFLAAALRLGASKSISSQQLGLIRKDIEDSISDVAESITSSGLTFDDQYQKITAAWDGVVRIRLRAEAETLELIDAHPLARTCLIEVVGEAVSNAAKHSKAPAMEIELQELGGDEVAVSVWSAGKLSARESRRGYGSQMLDEVTSGWSLTNLKGRVYLRATIPLSK